MGVGNRSSFVRTPEWYVDAPDAETSNQPLSCHNSCACSCRAPAPVGIGTSTWSPVPTVCGPGPSRTLEVPFTRTVIRGAPAMPPPYQASEKRYGRGTAGSRTVTGSLFSQRTAHRAAGAKPACRRFGAGPGRGVACAEASPVRLARGLKAPVEVRGTGGVQVDTASRCASGRARPARVHRDLTRGLPGSASLLTGVPGYGTPEKRSRASPWPRRATVDPGRPPPSAKVWLDVVNRTSRPSSSLRRPVGRPFGTPTSQVQTTPSSAVRFATGALRSARGQRRAAASSARRGAGRSAAGVT